MDTRAKTLVIAEAGVNHNGRLAEAKKLVDTAVESGADVVKFQTFSVEHNYNRSSSEEKRIRWAKSLQLSDASLTELIKYSNDRNICFLSSPFDEQSVQTLFDKGVTRFKVASSELCNFQLLRNVVEKECPIYLSVGMATREEIDLAVDYLREKAGQKDLDLTLLYCVSVYPATPQDHDLGMIQALERRYRVPVGFSDHSKGIELAIASVALGAKVIEKHIKLFDEHQCPDQAVSLPPAEFKKLVLGIRKVESAYGEGMFVLSENELESRKMYRKGLYSKFDLKKDQKITEEVIAFQKPAGGVGIQNYFQIINKPLKRNIRAGEMFSAKHVDLE